MSLAGKNILVIGSEGFIGHHCVKAFLNSGGNVTGVDLFPVASLPYNYESVSRLSFNLNEVFDRYRFDVVVNCSGSGSVPYSLTHPVNDFEANCLDVIRTLELLRHNNPDCKYLHISSAAVYGNPTALPVEESQPLHPISPYGWHKLVSENLCKEYHQIYGVKIGIIRPFSVFGPGLKKQLFWDLYKKVQVSSALKLMGTGNETRDFIFVTDLVRAIMVILTNSEMNASCYNVASGLEYAIRDAATTFFNAMDVEVALSFTGEVRAGDPANWRADISALQALGFTPSYTFETGIKELAAWLKQI